MSYGFQMGLVPVPDRGSAYDLCQKAAAELLVPETLREYIKSVYPSCRWRSFEKQRPSDAVLDIWLRSISRLSFVYWPQHNLLALLGDYPDTINKLFPIQVYFQNSCDQDYPLDTWGSDVPLFEDIKQQVSTAEKKTLLAEFWCDDDIDENDAYSPALDYLRQSIVYKRIFSALDLDNWLYGRPGQFERIMLSGLITMEQELSLQPIVKQVVNF